MEPKKLDLDYKGPESLSPKEKRSRMKSIYWDAVDEIPMNAPKPRGKSVEGTRRCVHEGTGTPSHKKKKQFLHVYLLNSIIFYNIIMNTFIFSPIKLIPWQYAWENT